MAGVEAAEAAAEAGPLEAAGDAGTSKRPMR
jgi:hypothetical protein